MKHAYKLPVMLLIAVPFCSLAATSADAVNSFSGTYEIEVHQAKSRSEGDNDIISKAILVLATHPFDAVNFKATYGTAFAQQYKDLQSAFKQRVNACFASVDIGYSFDEFRYGIALLDRMSLGFGKATIDSTGTVDVPILRGTVSTGDIKLRTRHGRVTGTIEYVYHGVDAGGLTRYEITIRRVADAGLSYCLDFASQHLPELRAEQHAFVQSMKRLDTQYEHAD